MFTMHVSSVTASEARARAVSRHHGFPGAGGGRRRYPGRCGFADRHRLLLRGDDVEAEVIHVGGCDEGVACVLVA